MNTLRYKVKNVLNALDAGEVNIVPQGCNCFHSFGGGLAYYIREKYPEADKVDKTTSFADKSKLGTISFAKVEENGFIVNCYTQFHYSKKMNNEPEIMVNGKKLVVLANYVAIRKAMIEIRKKFNKDLKIGMPKIGAGLANGEWTSIEMIIKQELIDHGYDVVFYVIDPKEIPENRTIV